MLPRRQRSQPVVKHLSWAVLSVRTMGRKRVSKGIKARLEKARGAIARLHSIWKSNQNSLKPNSDCITAMWNLSCSMVLSAGLSLIKSYLSPFTIVIREIRKFTEKLVARVLPWKLNLEKSDDWVMYLEWINIISPSLPCDGHHPAKEA